MMSLFTVASCGGFNEKTDDSLTVQLMHSCRRTDCRVCAAEFKAVCPPMPQTMVLPDDVWDMPSPSSKHLVSSELSIMLDEGFCIKQMRLDRMQALYDLRLYVDIAGKKEIVPLDGYLERSVQMQDAVVREYQIDSVRIIETIRAVQDSPVAVLHYQWEGKGLRKFFADYKTDLGRIRRKAVARTCSLEYGWSPELNAMVVRDPQKRRVVIFGANAPGMNIRSGQYGGFVYDDRRIRTLTTEDHMVASCLEFLLVGLDSFDIVVAATENGQERLLYDYASALRAPLRYVR